MKWGIGLTSAVVRIVLTALLIAVAGVGPANAVTLAYTTTLSGANENPPAASSGTGVAIVTLDTVTHLMGVSVVFSGLSAVNTASHIHCCAPAPTNAGVATTTPTFTGFPTGVTAGTYTNTFDLTLASSWNPAFITANGGTTAGAEAALTAGLAAGSAYLNIHTTLFPGGEIRGYLLAPATHFSVTAPASATAGSAFTIAVTALDASNATATGYSGVVHFTSTDGAAILPADATLTNGVGTFSATLKTAGSRTITATDTVTSSITGTSNAVTVSAAAATHLSVSAPASATGGSAFSFTATALDAFNNTATTYAGTVHFTSTDGAAVLPANSTLTLGTGTFAATLNTAGNQTITGTDTVTSSITGISNVIVVGAAPTTQFSVSAPGTVTLGTAFSITITARTASNAVATGYSGTVHFTSSDPLATLPANSTLTNGVGTFSVTLRTAGNQTITVTDAGEAIGTGTVSVAPAGPPASIPTLGAAGYALLILALLGLAGWLRSRRRAM